MKKLGGPVRAVVASLVVVAALFVFVFPSRAYLAQRAEIDDVREDLSSLREQNELLAEEATRLEDPTEIEAIAREQFNLVRPGERAFAVIPAPSPAEGGAEAVTPAGPDPAVGSESPLAD